MTATTRTATYNAIKKQLKSLKKKYITNSKKEVLCINKLRKVSKLIHICKWLLIMTKY
ncbi:hypothetical protein [Mycoplasmopsis cynos]|uniref:hypothetical protein n=1 Tax=Mycoplasmopsis cynos TaxID=171284 RepID=UPI003BB13D9F